MPSATERPPTSQISSPAKEPAPSPSTPSRAKRRAALKKGLIIAGLFLIVAGALAPLTAKWAINYLIKTRLSSTIALKQLSFNPFTGQLNLSVTQDNQVILERNQMKWDYAPLLRRTLRLNDIHLKNVSVEVKRFADGSVQIGDIQLEGVWKTLFAVLQSVSGVLPIYVEVHNVLIETVQVKYSDPQIEATVAIDQLNLQAAGSGENAFVRLGVLKNLTQQLDFTGAIGVSGLQVQMPHNPQAAASEKSTTLQKLHGLEAQFSGLAQFSDLHVALEPGQEAGRWNLAFRVASMEMTDQAVLRLQGKKFRTPLDVTFQPLHVNIKNLDSARRGEETSLTLETAAGGRSKIRYALTGKPLEKPFSVAGVGKIVRFDLVPLSPLVERFIGYRVKAGQFNLDSKDSVKRGVMDSKWAMLLNRFELQKLESPERDPMAEDLGVPLDTGVTMLKDKNDDIRLDLPLKADLNDPDQAFSSVVSGAMSTGIAAGVRASMSKVFSPFSSGKTFQMAPLNFAPGEAALSAESQQYLKEVGKLLADRPGLKLKIRGFGPSSDAKLVTQRAENVKTHLTSTYAIQPERLLISNPELSDSSAPRVELSL